jgi:arsenate reductase
MQEIGIDISHHRSKTLDEISGMTFDLAVTLCDRAHQICPVVSCAKKIIHCGFPDPHLTYDSDEELIKGYRSVRDGISVWIDKTLEHLRSDPPVRFPITTLMVCQCVH